MPKVWNKKNEKVPKGAVYIGRPSKWGNPFFMIQESQRDRVLKQYEEWLDQNPKIKEAAKRELRGKDLVCFCSPKKCHGDVLFRIANEEDI